MIEAGLALIWQLYSWMLAEDSQEEWSEGPFQEVARWLEGKGEFLEDGTIWTKIWHFIGYLGNF